MLESCHLELETGHWGGLLYIKISSMIRVNLILITIIEFPKDLQKWQNMPLSYINDVKLQKMYTL